MEGFQRAGKDRCSAAAAYDTEMACKLMDIALKAEEGIRQCC